jgi:hypothetical protein
MHIDKSLLSKITRVTILTVISCLAILWLSIRLWPSMTNGQEEILGGVVLLVPAIAAWGLFRKLQKDYSKPLAWTIAAVLAILTPVSLVISFACGQIPGGYLAFGGGGLGLIGAIIFTLLVATVLNLTFTIFVMWVGFRTSTGPSPK